MDKNNMPEIKYKPFKPEKGKIYTNHSGFQYECLAVSEDTAVFKSAGGWICTAHHLAMYENGTIEWDYSTDGHFEKDGGERLCV